VTDYDDLPVIMLVDVPFQKMLSVIAIVRSGAVVEQHYVCDHGHTHRGVVVAVHPERCAVSVWMTE